jgi:hypothetical protein
MREIERQATEAWTATPCEIFGSESVGERRAVAAHDFMVVQVPLQGQTDEQGGSAGANAQPGRSRPQKRRKKAYADRDGGGR